MTDEAIRWSRPLVLVVEHDSVVADSISRYLDKSGVRNALITDGRSALTAYQQLCPDLILLDAQMPGLDSWDVLGRIRQCDRTPVVMLSHGGTDEEAIRALDAGADDYITKPLSAPIVCARIRSILRRVEANAPEDVSSLLREGPIEIDLSRHVVRAQSGNELRTISLSLAEFRLLAYMLKAPNKVHSRSDLLRICLTNFNASERTIDNHVSSMRRKLEQVGVVGMPATVRGFGYRLVD
ncbi:TPA: response regulator transcription factor [Stenotrophomonas maltophilia]|nr:response regulator transcription factor [Stenotrophomonas maltophilia]